MFFLNNGGGCTGGERDAGGEDRAAESGGAGGSWWWEYVAELGSADEGSLQGLGRKSCFFTVLTSTYFLKAGVFLGVLIFTDEETGGVATNKDSLVAFSGRMFPLNGSLTTAGAAVPLVC